MKQKKETLVSKAEQLFKQNPDMKPIDMAKVLGVKVQRVYVLRNTLKKKLAKKASSKVTTKPVERMATTAKAGRPTNYVLRLEAEIVQYQKWCNEWRDKCDKLTKECTDVKVMFMDAQAVVKYLEHKVANLITINNFKGN